VFPDILKGVQEQCTVHGHLSICKMKNTVTLKHHSNTAVQPCIPEDLNHQQYTVDTSNHIHCNRN